MIQSLDDLILFLRGYHRYDAPADSSLIPPEFPPQLDTFYSELSGLIEAPPSPGHRQRTPFSSQDSIHRMEDIRYAEEMVEFSSENQGNWTCRCPFFEDDPPVYSNAEETWGDRPGFQIVCESLTHFLTTLALQETVMGSSNLIAIHENEAAEKYISDLPPLWLDGIYVFGEPSHQFYWLEELKMIAMNYSGNGLWIGSSNEGIFEELPCDLKFEAM